MNQVMKIKSRSLKWVAVCGSCFIGIFFIFFFGDSILNKIVQKQIQQKMQQFLPQTRITFSSTNAHLFPLSFSVKDLIIRFSPDNSNHQHLFYFPSVEFSDINFISLIFSKKFLVNRLSIGKGTIKLDSLLINKNDFQQKNSFPQIPFKNISIQYVDLAETQFWLKSDFENRLLLKGSIAIDKINIGNLNKAFSEYSFRFGTIKSILTEINYSIPDAYHTLQIKKLLIDSKKDILQIDTLKIIPQYPNSKLEKVEQTDRIEASIAGITFIKPDIMKLYKNKLFAPKIILNEMNGKIFSNPGTLSNLKKANDLTYFKKLPVEIKVDSFKINNSSFFYEGFSVNDKRKAVKTPINSILFKNSSINHLQISESIVSLNSNNLNRLRVKGDINIDSIEINNPNAFFKNTNFHFAAIKCDLKEIESSIPRMYSAIKIRKLNINSNKETMQMDNLNVIPKYTRFELDKKLGYQTDYLEATVSQIKATKLNVMKLFDQELTAEKIAIDQCRIHVFRDRRLPRILKPQPLPVAYLKSVPWNIRLNYLLIDHSSVAYEEFPKDGTMSGTLKVENAHVLLSPFINHQLLHDPDYIEMQVEASIMGSGNVNASAVLPFKVNKSYFVKGAINNLDLTSLNSSAENLGKFHIKSGMLNNLSFSITLNEKEAAGAIVGEYHNLIVDKLKGNSKKIAWFPSFIVRHLIIPKNKDKTKPVANRTGKIEYKRDPTRSASFYLLQSLLSGIKSSFTFGFLLPK